MAMVGERIMISEYMGEDLDIGQRNDCHCDLIGMKVIIIKIR